MNIRFLAVASATAFALAGPAAAQGWSGGYVGGSFGSGEACNSGGGCNDQTNWSVFGGYLTESNDLVFGGEGEYASHTIDTAPFDLNSFRLKGRAGYNAGNVMPYAVVGVSSMDFGPSSGNGTLFGVGVDVQATPNAVVGVEVLRESTDDIGGFGIDTDSVSLRGAFRF